LWGGALHPFNGSKATFWADTLCGLGNAAECVVNTAFGFFYCRNKRVTEMIAHLEPLGVSAQESIRSLGRFVWVGIATSAVVMVGPVICARLTTYGHTGRCLPAALRRALPCHHSH